MNSFAYIALIAWIPISVALFALMSPRRAALASLAVGWLALPVLEIPLPGLPDLDKPAAVSYGLILGVLLFDPKALLRFQPRLPDLAMLAWLLSAAVTSVINDAGLRDAFAQVWSSGVDWGIPYLIGRLYLNSREGIRDLLWTLFLSGLVYAPFALFEVRMSPQLHRIFYGQAQHVFAQTIRGGGFRPMVFMRHGLELALWLAGATVAGACLWRSAGPRRIAGIPIGYFVAMLAGTVLLCKSTGATLLCLVSLALLSPTFARWPRRALVLMVPAFLVMRIAFNGVVEPAVVELTEMISADRAQSIAYRFANEEVLLRSLWDHPLFGVGKQNFVNSVNPWTGDVRTAIPDSLWIITVVTSGLIGLVGMQAIAWLPAARAVTARAGRPEVIGAGLVLLMMVIDNLVNAMRPAMFIAIAGGLACVSHAQQTATAPTSTGRRAAARGRLLRPRSPQRADG